MTTARVGRPTIWAVLAVFMLAVGLTACSSNNNTTSSGSTGAAGSNNVDANVVLARDYKGVVEAAPASGPKAVTGKTIWFSNCVAFEGCARFGTGLKAAAKVLGWNIKEIDNGGDPQKSISIMRQAIAAKADGIIDTLSDCPNVKTGLKAAKDANIPVITYAGLDCDNTALGTGGESLYSGHVRLGKAADSLVYYRDQGTADADHILALARKQGIKDPGIVTALPQGQLFQDARSAGFAAEIKKLCSTCKVDPINFTVAQAVGKGQQIITSGILQHSSDTVFYYGSDAFLPLGIQASLQANTGKFKIICCGDGGKLSTANARDNKLAKEVAVNFAPLEMWGWDTADVLNRLLAGKSSADIPAEANVTYYFDKDHNLPASGPVKIPYDYVKAFTDVWKGSGS